MNKLDRRVVRTHRWLADAIIKLTLERGYHSFSVRDLTAAADVSYSTFFRHFKSKDELMTYVLMNLIADLEERLQPGMSIYDEALAMYRFVLEKQDVYRAAFKLPRNCPAVKKAWARVRKVTYARYMAREECDIPFEASVNHLINSVLELTRWWLTEGQHFSPEEIAKAHAELIVKVAEEAAFDKRGQSADKAAGA